MVRRMVKYNPSFLTEDELVNNFVVRHTDLELIMRVISENTTGSNQHVLVIGPRGSGKTTLALRVAAEIERDAGLREKWYPLVFSEESYRATSAADFWLEALFHLAEQTGEEKWLRAYQEMRDELDDKRLADRPLWQLLDFADSQGKRILLIVENLHMLFADLASDDEAWKMRHTLINEPRLMLLATATTRFEDVENPSQAMFEMFKMHELKPLEDEECNAIWELVAGAKLPGSQIRPIRILTGGNARLLAIIARFGAHRSFRQLLDDLVDLIDDHTDYFKSRIDHMPSTERKVYLSLAELWKPSTAREIARVARLDVNKTSSLLNRLAGRGDVVVESRSKKTKWYRLAEGIYNIYYLMRRRGRSADRVKATVTFMIAMYGHESATRLLAEEACSLSPELCREHYTAYGEIIRSVRDRRVIDRIIASTPRGFLESPYFDEYVKSIMTAEGMALEEKGMSGEVADLEEARNLNRQGVQSLGTFFRKGDFEQPLIKFEQVITQFKSTKELLLLDEVANALFLKGFIFAKLDKSEEEIAIYDDVVRLYDGMNGKKPAEQVVKALIKKGATLARLDRFDEAIAAYDEVVRRYGGREEKELAGGVAKALVNKGEILCTLNNPKGALQIYNEVIRHYDNREERELLEGVLDALLNKGITLGLLDMPEEEIATYENIVRHYGSNSEENGFLSQVALAYYYKSNVLGRLGRFDQAEDALLQVIKAFPDIDEFHLAIIKLLLKDQQRHTEALQKAEELINRKPGDAILHNSLAWAFYEQSISALLPKAEIWVRQAMALSPDDPRIHHTLACILCRLGKGDEALKAAKKYLQYPAVVVKKTIDDAIELFVGLAACGQAKEALDLLENSPAAKHLEPLIVGLKLFMGEEVQTAVEILEVAKDVVKKIEEQKQLQQAASTR
ncbi:MAG: tetratricopeptide repeat protein [Thermodesulfobacteriota bacterium]